MKVAIDGYAGEVSVPLRGRGREISGIALGGLADSHVSVPLRGRGREIYGFRIAAIPPGSS